MAAPDAQIPILPITVLVLVGLFLIQRHGTGSVGKVFGPVMLGWFAILAVMGVSWIVREPQVLFALDPTRALRLITQHQDRRARGACRRVPDGHGRRGLVCRHGPFRQNADSPEAGSASSCRRWFSIISARARLLIENPAAISQSLLFDGARSGRCCRWS